MSPRIRRASLVALTVQVTALAAACSSDDGDTDLSPDAAAATDAVDDAAVGDARADAFDHGDGIGDDADLEADAEPDPRATAVPAGDPYTRGPYPVGVTTFTLPDFEVIDFPVEVEVWYPAAEEGEALTAYRAIVVDVPAEAYRDVAPDPTAPSFLVVFSHGLFGVRQQNYTMAERLASWGYIVAAPDHPGTTTRDLLRAGNLLEPLFARPDTIRRTADAMFGGVVEGLRPREHGYAFVGHSLGALTGLVVGGGRIESDRYTTACAGDPLPFGCDLIGPIEAPQDEIDARVRPDERVLTSVLQNPAGHYAFDPVTLASIRRALVVTGERDNPDGNALPVYELLDDDAAYAVYDRAGHNGPTDICNIPLASSFSPDCKGEAEGYTEPDITRDLAAAHVVAWLGVHLGESPSYADWLGPGEGFTWRQD